MKKISDLELKELQAAAKKLLNDNDAISNLIADMDKSFKDLGDRNAAAHAKHDAEHPEQAACDHGVFFDKEKAEKMISESLVDLDKDEDPALAFIMGSFASPSIKKMFPRLCGLCPKGCGFNGIAYASMDHYIMGDW